MNISKLTAERLRIQMEKDNAAKAKAFSSKDTEKLPEPIIDVSGFFSEISPNLNNPFMSDEEKFSLFEKNNPKETRVYDTITLSNLFRECKYSLNNSQVSAFEGIENLRQYIENLNCNCQKKLSQINQYYRDFVMGNSQTDLFLAMKQALKADKLIFYYESEKILEI